MVVTKGNNLPNSRKDKEFNTWWINDVTIFSEMLFPEEGLQIVKGFDRTSKVGNTTFTVNMMILPDEKGDANTSEKEGRGAYKLLCDMDESKEDEKVQGLQV
jgi:hypothetical protein